MALSTTTDRIIAGAWCIVEGDRIVRASRSCNPGVVSFWAAGRGSWSRNFGDRERRSWPVHYAGAGPQLPLLEDPS